MKKLLLLVPITFIILTSCIESNKPAPNAGEKTFNWTDTSFTVGAKRRIQIEYNLDDCGIREESKKVLDTVVRFMKHNSKLKIGVYSHTDQQGQAKHNLVLSQARSRSMADYIISIGGIDSARLVPKGWGFSQPLPGFDAASIAKMQTKEEKQAAYQADRRTEVVILATDYHGIK